MPDTKLTRQNFCNCLHTIDRHHKGGGCCMHPGCGCLKFITVSEVLNAKYPAPTVQSTIGGTTGVTSPSAEPFDEHAIGNQIMLELNSDVEWNDVLGPQKFRMYLDQKMTEHAALKVREATHELEHSWQYERFCAERLMKQWQTAEAELAKLRMWKLSQEVNKPASQSHHSSEM